MLWAHVFLDSRLSNWLCFSAHSWTKSFSSFLLPLSWAFLFSADEDARREEDEVDAGIEQSSLNWRDSGNESVRLLAVPQHGHASEEIEPSERNGKKQEANLDLTDWRGTARSLRVSTRGRRRWAGISSIINHVRAWQRIDPSWWILWIFVRKKIGRPRRDSRCCEMRT